VASMRADQVVLMAERREIQGSASLGGWARAVTAEFSSSIAQLL
jgi:hypothetical protein